jgi:hypothetical protein
MPTFNRIGVSRIVAIGLINHNVAYVLTSEKRLALKNGVHLSNNKNGLNPLLK